MEKDMTAGTPGKIIFNFTMPIFIGNIFQQFYNMADTVIVGKFVGNAALAAVGACGTLVFLIIGFLQGVTAGFTVVTAQHFGAGNMKAMKKSVASGAVLTGIVTVILTLLSMISMAKVLHLIIHRQTCMEKLTDILWSFAAGLWHRHFTIILQVY